VISVLTIIETYVDSAWKKTGASNILVHCPFHKDGKEKDPSCSIHVEKQLFYCFTCEEKGHLKRLLAKVGAPVEIMKYAESPRMHVTPDQDYTLPEHILSCYRYEPTPWISEGFDSELLKQEEIGFDIRNECVIIPIRKSDGGLLAIAGRNFEDGPRYKIYKRELGDFCPFGYSPKTHKILWRGHKLKNPKKIIVCEGYKAALAYVSAGFFDTVALMGCHMSEDQANTLATFGCPIVLSLDNNSAGISGTPKAARMLTRLDVDVSIVSYLDSREQPDGYTDMELKTMVGSAKPFHRWRQQ